MNPQGKCPCPEPQDLERLLSDSAASSAETDIVRHLDSCPECQQQLEKLAVCQSQVCELVEHIDRDQPDSKSAQEVTALWLYMRDRLARLYGPDPHWTTKPRADFSTAVLTPESGVGSPLAAVAAGEEPEEEWETELPAWANVAVATMERRKVSAPVAKPITAPPVTHAANDAAAQAERNALDRRKSDQGPPPGVVDRRQPRAFGRRSAH